MVPSSQSCVCFFAVRFVFVMLPLAPDMMKSVQVDKGAIKFVLGGANIMCRGITSPGGRLPDGLEKGEPVVGTEQNCARQAIFAEGKENPLAVGEMAMSSAEM